jgi:hypothetical protein
MRVGAIVVATLENIPSYGVVKQHDNDGLTAMFPVIETQSSIKLMVKHFKKEDRAVSRDHAVENRSLGMFLRQLTGIPLEVKESEKQTSSEPANHGGEG